MQSNISINLTELVMSIANAVDLFSRNMANHHKRVAMISMAIAREIGLNPEARSNLLFAALLHDIGALNLDDRQLATTSWETNDNDLHAEAAYLLLRKFRHFSKAALIILHHHTPWSHSIDDDVIPIESHILYLADRIDAMIDTNRPILSQANIITSTISRNTDSFFLPELTEAFSEVAWRESFWLEMMEPNLEQQLFVDGFSPVVDLDWDDLLDFSEMTSQLIDFRSRFTAAHSSGVAAVASILASLVGFSEDECVKMKVAGYLHDIGKLAIPNTILEKPRRLTEEEFQTMKSHVYFTHRILGSVKGLGDITVWASMHHERLDGQGYPFRQPGKSIPLGARLMAIADIYTALSEDRPYRNRANREDLLQEFNRLVKLRQIDGSIAMVLMDNHDVIERHRELAQINAVSAYEQYQQALQSHRQRLTQVNKASPLVRGCVDPSFGYSSI